MRAFALGLAAAAVLAAPASARPYAVDKSASRLGFTGSMGGAPFQGSFRRWDAVIDFDPNNLPGSRATVSVDMSSATTGDGARDEAMPSSDWFAVQRFPRATFTTRQITRTGPNRYSAAGDLTIRGVRRPVVLPFTLQLNGNVARMQGRLPIDRTAFGVGQGQFRTDGLVAKTVTITVDLTARALSEVEAAAEALRRGELVILPTETVYGLAADAANAGAVARLYEAKGRPQFNPLIAHAPDLEAARALIVLEPAAERLAEAFWPGPLTIVGPVRTGGRISELARAGLDTAAVRAPAHPLAQAVLAAFGGPVVAPSANRSGRPSPTTFADAVEETGDAASLALDGGPCAIGLESTVVASQEGILRLLRPGAVTRAEIEAVAGPLAEAGGDARRSPGRLAVHYAPDAPVRLNAEAPGPGEAFLAFGPAPSAPGVFNLSPAGDLREAAANLFAHLRAADRTRPAAIAVAPIPGHGLGEAINDRLRRAAGAIG